MVLNRASRVIICSVCVLNRASRVREIEHGLSVGTIQPQSTCTSFVFGQSRCMLRIGLGLTVASDPEESQAARLPGSPRSPDITLDMLAYRPDS